ncbi:hypothetical protein B0H16DRAFT_1485094 [Mycena metata]|uniref:Uncharacterized protein n=1 Tax=Mycena metata TaxID=1033252 RepID=A0AAD7GNI9_9AGAR|nr:hypothetical protein B0H16DRAFT_1485094 [Mycena metata]
MSGEPARSSSASKSGSVSLSVIGIATELGCSGARGVQRKEAEPDSGGKGTSKSSRSPKGSFEGRAKEAPRGGRLRRALHAYRWKRLDWACGGVWGDEQVDTLRTRLERVLANESRFPLRESLEERREREESVPLRKRRVRLGDAEHGIPDRVWRKPPKQTTRFTLIPTTTACSTLRFAVRPTLSTYSRFFRTILTPILVEAYGLNSRNGGKPSQAGSLQSSIDLMRLCPAQFAAVSCKSKYTVHLLDFLLATEDVLLELEIENVSARGDYIRVGGLGFCYPGEEVCSFSTNFRPFGMNQTPLYAAIQNATARDELSRGCFGFRVQTKGIELNTSRRCRTTPDAAIKSAFTRGELTRDALIYVPRRGNTSLFLFPAVSHQGKYTRHHVELLSPRKTLPDAVIRTASARGAEMKDVLSFGVQGRESSRRNLADGQRRRTL